MAELDELASHEAMAPDRALHAPMAHVGLSVAMRITSLRIAAALDGRSRSVFSLVHLGFQVARRQVCRQGWGSVQVSDQI
jgi:hypothetical protein